MQASSGHRPPSEIANYVITLAVVIGASLRGWAYRMPGIDGFAVAKQLRASANGSAIKLVALTGWGGPDDRQRTQATGFDHHFVKPITVDDLEAITATGDGRA